MAEKLTEAERLANEAEFVRIQTEIANAEQAAISQAAAEKLLADMTQAQTEAADRMVAESVGTALNNAKIEAQVVEQQGEVAALRALVQANTPQPPTDNGSLLKSLKAAEKQMLDKLFRDTIADALNAYNAKRQAEKQLEEMEKLRKDIAANDKAGGGTSRSRLANRYRRVISFSEYAKYFQEAMPSTIQLRADSEPTLSTVTGPNGETVQMEAIAFRPGRPVIPMSFAFVPPNVLVGGGGSTQVEFFSNQLANQGAKSPSALAAARVWKNKAAAKSGANTPWASSVKRMAEQERRLMDAPPVTLLVNPSTFTVSMNKKFSDDLARNRRVIEITLDELDKVSASGKTSLFYTTGTGLTRFYRRESGAWQNFMRLFLLYKNNGRIYSPDDANRIEKVGSVILTYDGASFIGSFDSFNIKEDASMPWALDYDFEFTVRRYVPRQR